MISTPKLVCHDVATKFKLSVLSPAYLNDAMEQLEVQIASAKIAMARLSSPQLYYVLSGNNFTLDINNPLEPKIIYMGNNP
jgi:hypothetical protein